MSPEHREYAELLLQKAREDLSASRALAATEGQTESIIGFHLQQAVEKALKSILAAAEIEIPHTHDIEQVLRVVIEAGVELPGGLVSAEWLTPWGVSSGTTTRTRSSTSMRGSQPRRTRFASPNELSTRTTPTLARRASDRR